MKKDWFQREISLLLSLCVLLSCTACGGKTEATTMNLRKTEGTVGVADGEGKAVSLKENMGLYSGYQVDTRTQSYAWIDLDKAKLTKLDEQSEIEIQKDGKNLEIQVLSGSLFFNVTSPLEDDESMTIRASSMMVGIRGTCGWVTLSEDGDTLSVCLLEGKVECSNGEAAAVVQAGEMGVIPTSGEIAVTALDTSTVPAFVQDEIEADSGPLNETDEPEGDSDSQETGWPRVTEEVLADGSVRVVEYYEDGSWIERMTKDGYSSVQERDSLNRAVRHEQTFGNDSYWLYTYRYQEDSSVVISALWSERGETVFQVENFSYTMLVPDNGVRVTGTSFSGGVDDYERTLTVSEFQMSTFKNVRNTGFRLDMSDAVIETTDEGPSEGYYG